MPEEGANSSPKKSSKRTCKADGSARLASYAEGLPSNIGTEPGKEHGHVCRQAAAAYINVMAHLMNQN